MKQPLLIALFSSIVLLSGCEGNNYAQHNIDLKQVLDVTSSTLTSYDASINTETNPDTDQVFWGLAEKLAINYNNAQPALYEANIGVLPQGDASLLAYADTNANSTHDNGEDLLYKIEIDGDNARILASSSSGEVQEQGFSMGGMMTGFLIGSLLSRQSGAGVSRSSMANKKTVSRQQASKARATSSARSRAGSGSHTSGK